MDDYEEFDDLKEKPKEEIQKIYFGEYFYKMNQLNQVEWYEGFWSKFLHLFSLQQTAMIWRHMKNKYVYIDISLYDLIWIICLCTFTLTIGLGILSYYTIDKHYEKMYERHHVIPRYYNQLHEMLATEHPDYVRQISDIIPCRDMETLITWKLNKRFATETNYCYVAKRNGYAYLQEVSDEEYEKAVEQFKGRKKAERGQQLLLDLQRKRQEQLKQKKK